MKVIDLLNKIAKGEEVPKKIKLDGEVYLYSKTYEQYHSERYDENLLETISEYNYSGLNDEIEIIEEDKKIEKLNDYFRGEKWFNEIGQERLDKNFDKFAEKINELIDEVNKLKGEEQ